jgi:hypothetical protein
LREAISPLRATIGARFVVIGATTDQEERIEVLIALEDQGWVEAELEAYGALRTGALLDGGSTFRLPDGASLDLVARDEPWVAQALDCPQAAPNGLPVIGLPYLVLFRLEASRTADTTELERLLGHASKEQLSRVRDAVDAYLPDLRGDLESLIVLGRLAQGAATTSER